MNLLNIFRKGTSIGISGNFSPDTLKVTQSKKKVKKSKKDGAKK